MNKLFKVELFLITKKNNSIFLVALIIYSFLTSNVFVWSKNSNTYIANSNEYNNIFFDSLISNFTFIWGLFFVYSYFSEFKNGFYSRLILNDFKRIDILKLKYFRMFFLLAANIILSIILYYSVQYIQFDSIKYQLNLQSLFLLLQILLMVFYSLCLAYLLCLYTNNMILSIFLVYFLTKLDLTLSYFEQIKLEVAKFNYLPISCIEKSVYDNINYLPYFVFLIYICLIIYFTKQKQLKINF